MKPSSSSPTTHSPTPAGVPVNTKVTNINRKIGGYVSDDFVEAIDHESGVSLLNKFFILVEAKIHILFILDILQRDPFSNSC